MILFFDTETTGVPKNYKAPMTDVENWPRCTQIAWLVCNNKGEIIESNSFLVKPDGWVVPKEKFFIDNNMSTERCEKEGTPMPLIIDMFIQSYMKCSCMVAHNMAFDINILGAETIRYKKIIPKKIDQICTMNGSTSFCKLPGNKWPKLIELHNILFGCDFEGAHDALYDVQCTARCFFELVKLGVIYRSNRNNVVFNGAEIVSNTSRLKFAEGLIKQLPESHEGRNTWLLNYGISEEAITLRKEKGLLWDIETQSCETINY